MSRRARSAGPPPVGTFRSAWRHRRWRRFLVSIAASTTGEFLSTVALIVFLIDTTGSAGWVAASFIVRMATFTLLGPIGGLIADRFDRRRLMVLLDVARCAVLLGVAVLIAADGAPGPILALIAVVAALTTPYRPAGVAATTMLVDVDDLAAANAAEASVGQLAWFVGPAIGAAIVAIASPSTAFVVTAGMFAVSALLTAGIGPIGGGRGGPGAFPRPPGVLGQLAGGARALRRLPGVPALTLLVVGVLFAYGVEQVIHVLVVTERLGLGADGVGMLNACLGAGGVITIPFAPRLAARRDGGQLFAVSAVLMGLPLALLAVVSSPIVAGALMVVEGSGNILFDVLLITLLQRLCPEDLLGRVFSLQDSCGSLFHLTGTIAAPLLVVGLGLESALIVGGGSLVVLAVVLYPALRAISARTDAERERLAPIVAELGALGILGEASIAARERIARAATAVHLPAGAVVFSEGDRPDDLFVVRSGWVVATTAAHGEVNRIGPGDWFGEIGLLHGVPRTATVTVVEPVELLAIGGRQFLDAVTSSDVLPEPLAGAMSTRLARSHPEMLES